MVSQRGGELLELGDNGKTGSIRRFKEQLNRLAATRMQLLYYDEDHTSMVNASSAMGRYDVFFPKDPLRKSFGPPPLPFKRLLSQLYGSERHALDSRAAREL